MQNALEATRLVVRMTAQDRQAINRMTRHKCQEFESIVQKGVVAMLNAQEESERLAEKRAEYLSFLSSKNQQKRAQLRQISQASQELVGSAPMGVGPAGQVVISTAAHAGDALYHHIEQQRQQTEAEERLFSAQMLFYIPPQDYEKIAKRVASILSYRYQLLIFRLATGENGYIKLANFFVSSMKNYAIARLREQKNDVVKALIHAAIPPSSDALRYRDWPSIDISNYRTQLIRCGGRKTLELDESANQIIKRCGPAVRALLGGHLNYIDPANGLIKNYQAYTLIGALNHALILNAEGRIHTGSLPKNRQYWALDGNVKYPMILLGKGERTADLAVNFATQTTDIILDALHREALKRLVPSFFSYEVSYQLDKDSSEIMALEAVQYSEEKYECPWTQKRQHQLQERLQKVFADQNQPERDDDLETFEESLLSRSMLSSANQHYLQTKIEDALTIETQVQEAIAAVYHTEAQVALTQKYAADNAKYNLFATQELMYSMYVAQDFSKKHFDLARKLIETANLAIFSSRETPFIEVYQYQLTLTHILELSSSLQAIQLAQEIDEMNYHTLLDVIQLLAGDKQGEQMNEKEQQMAYRKGRLLRTQINDSLREMQRILEMGQVILQYDESYEDDSGSLDIAYQEVMEDIRRCRQLFFESIPEDFEAMSALIQKLLEDSHLSLRFFEDIPSAIRPRFSPNELFTQLRDKWKQHQHQYKALKEKHPAYSWFQQGQYQNLTVQAKQILENLKPLHQKIQTLFEDIEYPLEHHDKEIRLRVQSFYQRARLTMQFSFLNYLQKNCPLDHNIQKLYQKTKRVFHAWQYQATEQAAQQYQISKDLAASLTREMSHIEVRKILQQIKKDKYELELKVRHDIEILQLGKSRAHLILRDAEQCFQDMQEISKKMDFIQENTDELRFLNVEHFKTQAEMLAYFETKITEMSDRLLSSKMFPASERAIFQNRIRSEFSAFQETIKKNISLSFTPSLGIHFLCKIAKSISQNELKKLIGFQNQEDIRKPLQQMNTLSQNDLYDLMVAQKKSLKLMKKCFQGFLFLKQKAKEFKDETTSPLRLLSYTQSTLIWSGRLNVNEQKWIDKIFSQQSKKLLENAREFKSASRMAFSFILALVNEDLLNKKRDLNRLRKLEHDLEKTKLLPLKWDTSPSEERASNESLLQQKQQLTQAIDSKIRAFDRELDDLVTARKALFQKVIGLFFWEWKAKTFDSPATHHGFFKLAQNTQRPATTEVDNTNQASYSIDTLETWFESFQLNCEQSFFYKLAKNSPSRKDPEETYGTNTFKL